MKDCKLSICELDGNEKKVTLEFILEEKREDYKELGEWDDCGTAANYYEVLISSANTYDELVIYAAKNTHYTWMELKDLVDGTLAALFMSLR